MPAAPDAGVLRPILRRVHDRIAQASDVGLWLLVFAPLLVLYVATGNVLRDMQSPDAVAAAMPAWHFATYHTLFLDHYFTTNPWVFVTHGHTVSNRQPGVVLFGVPFYLALGRGAVFNMFPAVVAAATAAAGAVAFVTVTLRSALNTRLAVLTGGVLALGTATWSVSADTLWPHGPDELFLAAAMFFLSRRRLLPASIAIALCVPIRAHLAVFALVAGIWYAWRRRSIKPIAMFGLPAGVAVAGLLSYNHWMFDTWSLNGGYPPYSTANLQTFGSLTGHFGMPTNVLGALFSLDRGLVIWCPILVVLAFGLRGAWRAAPTWVRISAVAGVAYFLIQMKINFFSGGDRFWSYRLTIESVVLVTPLCAYAARALLGRRSRLVPAAVMAAIYGIGTQAVGAIFYTPEPVPHSAWTHSKLAQVLVNGGAGPRVVMGATVVAMAVAAWRCRAVLRPTPGDETLPAAATPPEPTRAAGVTFA